jgi:DnaJ-class molecular chaperone
VVNTKIKDVGCSVCNQSGKVPIYIDHGDADYTDNRLTGKYERCSRCNGRGKHQVMFIVSDRTCSSSMSATDRSSDLVANGYLTCHNGTMYNDAPYHEYPIDMKRRYQRPVKHRSISCPFCFGTGKGHHVAKKEKCSTCKGQGEFSSSVWEPSFFGGEVQKTVTKKCDSCDGHKFHWVIDHSFSETTIHTSNL